MFINDNCKLKKSFYIMSIPKVYTSHGARKLSDKDGIVWFVRTYGKIHELKRVDYLTYAQLYDKFLTAPACTRNAGLKLLYMYWEIEWKFTSKVNLQLFFTVYFCWIKYHLNQRVISSVVSLCCLLC